MSMHTVSEPDSHSDSDWLDIASTDRDSDDNDSIYSSREADHEIPSRSRSRRSSLSYSSSRDGDVDAWEGFIEDSADDSMPHNVPTPNPHVASLSQFLATPDLNNIQDTSTDDLRVREGLDQSMISTLSSSRSSSLHASTVQSSTRDLRLSFPDPITSSCKEPLGIPDGGAQPGPDVPFSRDSVASSDAHHVDDGESSVRRVFAPPQSTSVPIPSEPELKIFLFGFPTIFKWSIVNKLVQKIAHGAGVSIDVHLESLQGSVRRLTVSGSFEHDRAFPRMITVFDRTLQPHDTADDLVLDFSGIHPLAIDFMPCRPPGLPEHAFHLPILLPSWSGELSDFGNVETDFSWNVWNTVNIPNERILQIAGPGDSSVIDQDSIDMLDPSRVYRVFSRLWAGEKVSKGIMASTHALTIIAILSLILGLVVRAALPVALQQFASPTIATFAPNCTSCSFWQLLRPAPYRERLPAPTTLDSSVVAVSSFEDSSLSVFSAESTSVTLPRTTPTNFRRMIPSTLSEHPKFSKDLILQPPYSVLPSDDRPKALSVIPETSPSVSYASTSDTTGHTVPALRHTSVPGTVKECASVVLTIVTQDLQDVFDALDALVQAISRQTQMILTQATTFLEQPSLYLEKGVESFEVVKGTLRVHNERARKRAKEIKERGEKWLFDASEVITTGARISKGMAWELAEGLAHRAQHARGRAKEMASEIQDFLNERDTVGVLGIDTWDASTKNWDEWVRRMRKQGMKPCKRKLQSSIFC